MNATSSLVSPEYIATRRAKLAEDLKTLSNTDCKSQGLWEAYGFEVQTVESLEQGRALAEEGIPSKLWMDERFVFVPEILISQAVEAAKQAKAAAETEATEERIKANESSREEFIKANNRLKSVSDMLKTPEIDWIVQDKIQSTGLCQIFGASYAGKTLLVLDLVMSWCAGLPEWQGYKLNNDGKPQDALYVAAEGGAAVSVHVDAWLKYHPEVDPSRLNGLVFLDGGDGDHMFLGVNKSDVDDKDSWDRLLHEVIALDLNPSLVVFDTQIDLAPGVDENSNTDMVGVLREVKRLGDTAGFMAIVVHHTGHDGNKARGASGMMGKCDSQAKLEVIGERSGKAKLTWTKVKGRAVPKDSISYHIQGIDHLPDLDSEGAVCVPIGKLESAITEMTSKMPTKDLQDRIMLAIGQDELSIRQLSDAVDLDRGSSEFKNALEWMSYSALIDIDKSNPKAHKIRLAPFAVAPSLTDTES